MRLWLVICNGLSITHMVLVCCYRWWWRGEGILLSRTPLGKRQKSLIYMVNGNPISLSWSSDHAKPEDSFFFHGRTFLLWQSKVTPLALGSKEGYLTPRMNALKELIRLLLLKSAEGWTYLLCWYFNISWFNKMTHGSVNSTRVLDSLLIPLWHHSLILYGFHEQWEYVHASPEWPHPTVGVSSFGCWWHRALFSRPFLSNEKQRWSQFSYLHICFSLLCFLFSIIPLQFVQQGMIWTTLWVTSLLPVSWHFCRKPDFGRIKWTNSVGYAWKDLWG